MTTIKEHIVLHETNPTESYKAAIWDHTVLPATRQVNVPRLNPSE